MGDVVLVRRSFSFSHIPAYKDFYFLLYSPAPIYIYFLFPPLSLNMNTQDQRPPLSDELLALFPENEKR